MKIYICTRSLRNGALSFVAAYTDQTLAQHVVNLANQGLLSCGPSHIKYVLINAF